MNEVQSPSAHTCYAYTLILSDVRRFIMITHFDSDVRQTLETTTIQKGEEH